MKKISLLKNHYAVSEIIGATLLVLIAVISASYIYFQMLPVPIPPPEPNVQLMGYVTEDGEIIIEHMGGEILYSYEVMVDYNSVYINPKDEYLNIGDRIPSDVTPILIDENDNTRITINTLNDDASKSIVFDAIFYGPREEIVLPPLPPPIYSMPITTLRTNSVDEDIICYSSFITPNINPVNSYIYNWMVDRGSGFTAFTNLLFPFDTNNEFEIVDYSGNNPNGTVYGANWDSNGIIGGAFSFNGDDFISFPYCFEEDFLDELTVEAWVKPTEMSGTVVTYERGKYWELAISDGYPKWSTTANGLTIDVRGPTNILDGLWHHITTTYDSSTGDCNIYVDGLLDISENMHPSGDLIGIGNPSIGFVGKGTGSAETETIFSTGFETQDEKNQWNKDNEIIEIVDEEVWEQLWYDDFESGWGNWNDGGGDVSIYYFGTYAHQGSCAVDIQDDSGWGSTTYSDYIPADSADYTEISIDFWWRASSMESGEDFWVDYDDGTTTHRLKTLVIGTGEYINEVFYHTVCTVSEVDYGNFTDFTSFRIQCDASGNYDDVYIDEIYINASIKSRLNYDFDRRDSNYLSPKEGIYSIGGTGELSPEYAAFNRSAIDISSYVNVKLSVWYSYKNTDADDFFGLYYKNNDLWEPIFEVDNPDIFVGQSNWTYYEADIPNYIENLVLQFKWMTSSTDEYVAIDDLKITGILPAGENNYTGLIDEIKIYNKVLSPEQIYQNYLQSQNGDSTVNVIVSEETFIGDLWKCIVTPNNGYLDDVFTESDVLYIENYPGGV